ncbi:MAG: DNA translocase FtsK [Planctomycetes bacterium]|nr:DNA translocase FtsK [Planctomycetota bacterium]
MNRGEPPEATTDAALDAPTCDGRAYVEVQRRAFRALLDLSADAVAPLETEIAERFERGRAAADTRLDESLSRIKSLIQEKLNTAEQEHDDRSAQIRSKHDAAQEALATNSTTARDRLAAEYREVEREGGRRREDRLLIAETVEQATLKGLAKDFAAVERQVAEQRQELEALDERTLHLLQDYRYEPESGPADAADVADEPADAATAYNEQARRAVLLVEALRSASAAQLFIGARPWILLVFFCVLTVGGAGAALLLQVPGAPSFTVSGPVALGVTLLLSLLAGRALRRKANAQIRSAYEPFRQALAAARRALDLRMVRAKEQLRRDETAAAEQARREQQAIADEFDALIAEARRRRGAALEHIENSRSKQHGEIEQLREHAARQVDGKKTRRVRELCERRERDSASAKREHEQETAESRAEHEAARAALEAQWDVGIAHVRELLDETDRIGARPRIDLQTGLPEDWTPPRAFTAIIPYGHWRLDLSRLADGVLQRAGFTAKRSGPVSLPALLTLPTHCSLLLQTERAGRRQAIETLRMVMLRLLTSLPPGRAHFTIFDPVGLGENFAGFMHLVDYEDALVCGRIWTESDQIEARLTELTSHMENVIQKYLRNEFESIAEYNHQAGELAEPYRFLVIADLPANFSEGAARRLSSIVSSGARCGVFTLIAHDKRLATPPELQIEDLAGAGVHLVFEGDRFVYQDELLRQFPLTLEPPPTEEVLTSIMHAVGREAKDSLRVEVPFETIVPTDAQRWTANAAAGIDVPLGHTGAIRQQHLRLGRGIAQHALIAGKTGSGKSTLLHVMITNLALRYSPEEVEFYLVDFKKGVEFKTYVTHELPHARAIAIESDREFGVSVLQRIDAEMARRGDLFRSAGVQDIAAYREATGRGMPRTLLIVDEFQVFFTEDDKLSQDAGILLDRLVRQGRAFGIHVLLGSQTLGGTAGLARSTMGQMAVRIALQCSEADSQLILDDTNVAARLLSRPGEAIYNDAGGLVEGNSPFQTAWLPDERRNVHLESIRALAQERRVQCDPPIVFEGNAPADIRRNRTLAGLLEAPEWPPATHTPRAWLGEAVAIKDPTHATFRRQSGSNLLLVGQQEDAALAMMAAAMLCLGAQHAPRAARFFVLDGRPSEAPRTGGLHDVAAVLPHQTQFVAWREVADVVSEIADEARRRLDADRTDAPAVYFLIYGLQRYRMLRRQEEDFSFSTTDEDKPAAPDKLFAELLREGPPFGLHVLAWSDTLATLERTLDRQSIGEFDFRVLFQMSAADSSNLIDTPEANRLGFYRAMLYSEERGLLEKFRPYATFDEPWLAHARQCLHRRHGEQSSS